MKIGVLGGTFDPIHYVHLMLAEHMAGYFGLSKILFIPTGRPPHKDESRVVPAMHRVEMTRLAITGNPKFELSTIESDFV
ncbi:MAG: adenylyltransferase/cytidyltransferase family protein, partial [Clostridiales bacterium]|nr:adenylyltransferase/cytidyltransferase family protein [Clostridiales bacterium]